MKIIVGVNNGGYIGKDGDLMWRCKADLKHFKDMTTGSVCLVGRKTFESLPPLKNREMIIVGREHTSLEDALAQNPDWILGGGEIYRQTVHLCDELHISIINNDDIGDTMFEVPADYKGKIFYYRFEEDKS